MNFNSCCKSFQSQTAYIIINKTDKLCETISIQSYINDSILQKEVLNKKKMIVCTNRHELIKVEPLINKSHFRHKLLDDVKNSPMTEWHAEWQGNFLNIEKFFEFKKNGIKNRKADVAIHDLVIEFQHSPISLKEVKNRQIDYCKCYDKKLIWVIDCNDTIEVNELMNGNFMIKFISNYWKYENFKCHKYVYLNVDNRLFQIDPNEVQSHMIDVNECILKDAFIENIKNNNHVWNTTKLPQCILYHNQRGAGCGKTYESIQLIQNDSRFVHKTTYVYLTKMHSAKEVIYNEFKEQLNRGSLSNLEITSDEITGKQYKVKFLNKKTNNECIIIIGTIDSFMWRIGNKLNTERDFYYGIIKSIKDGFSSVGKEGHIKYARDSIQLNKECLIIIDEAQDLNPTYVEAVCKIMRNTYIDTYIIGDKLQSISYEHNIFTFLENNELPNTKIVKTIGSNHVRRFHNKSFIPFVNDIIDFNKYNLPEIESICDGNCKYKHETNKGYELFAIPAVYNNDTDLTKVHKVIDKIIDYMDIEIEKYNYLPKNFMFIFDHIKKNFLAKMLQERLQDYWIQKFTDEEYIKNIDDITDNNYNEFVFLHKSEANKPINLKESENATRMLSIHASKGNGCEVVFVLGITETVLNMYSKQTDNLLYNSLLHVALTRQKKSLYVGIVNNGDDIYHKFKKYNIKIDIEPNLNLIKKSHNYDKIITKIVDNNFSKLNDVFIKTCDLTDLIPKSDNNKLLDWGHHIIRYWICFYYLLFYMINDPSTECNDDQLRYIMKSISSKSIKFLLFKQYSKTIIKDNVDYIPLLYFTCKDYSVYNNYKHILKAIIINIQKKIKREYKKKKVPRLCPLECIILLHLIELNQGSGKYGNVKIMDLYSIIYYYDECNNALDEEHKNRYKCKCKDLFTKLNNNNDKYSDIRTSIINHYQNTRKVKKIYNNLKLYCKDKLKTSKFKYNILHPIVLNSNNNTFKIYGKFRIIARSQFYILNFILKPQFNKLNFNEIYCRSIYDNYLINNSKNQNNKEKFDTKEIVNCIVTLDSVKPIFYKIPLDDDKRIYLIETLKIFLKNYYVNSNQLVYKFYKYCKKYKPKNINSLLFTKNKLSTYLSIPSYIESFFDQLLIELKINKKKVINILNDEMQFMSKLEEYLDNSLDNYLSINDEGSSDIDF